MGIAQYSVCGGFIMVHKYRPFFTVHHDENRNEPSSLGWEKDKYTFPSGLKVQFCVTAHLTADAEG